MAETLRDYGPTSTIDILDRVLDKGIVIDGLWRFYVGGLHLITIDARFVVASIETYLRHAPVLARTGSLPWRDLPFTMPSHDVPAGNKSRRRRG
jgi:hypothetical protein